MDELKEINGEALGYKSTQLVVESHKQKKSY
jgi:hypothetical protein